MHAHITYTISDVLPITTLQNSYHYTKTHGTAFGTPGITTSVRNMYLKEKKKKKNRSGELEFQTVKNIMNTASTYNGSLYLLMNKAC